jgi:hypothetical protein
VTLFGGADEPTPQPVKRDDPDAAAKWSTLNTRGRCDHCIRDLAAGRRQRVANTARWLREQGGQALRLCYECARPVRDADAAIERRIHGRSI